MEIAHFQSPLSLRQATLDDWSMIEAITLRSTIMRHFPPLAILPEGDGEGLWIAEDQEPVGICTMRRMPDLDSNALTLSFAFDRCLAGRAHAKNAVEMLFKEQHLDHVVSLAGPASANFRRVLKSVGFASTGAATVSGVECEVFEWRGNKQA